MVEKKKTLGNLIYLLLIKFLLIVKINDRKINDFLLVATLIGLSSLQIS